MLVVTQVRVPGAYRLQLMFSNGEKREFDMQPYLEFPVFRPLKNQGLFELASVNYGTVVWPGEIDIAPETLYQQSRLLNS